MELNVLGRIVEACWLALPGHYPRVILDSFVVMPNHFHGLVALTSGIDSEDKSSPPLFEIVRAFKSFSSRQINARRHSPGIAVWQRGYHEHIARRDEALDRIRAYIETNPLRWHLDKENPANATRP